MISTAFAVDLPGFGAVTVTPFDPVGELDEVYPWVLEERAQFWGMREHTREHVQELYAHLDTLDTHHAWMVRLDGTAVALFQTYWTADDELSEHYEARPGDLGIHLLLGPGHPKRGWNRCVVMALVSFVLQDPAVSRLVAEPDARNRKAVALVTRLGFTKGPVVQLPHKPAQLVFLERADLEALLA